MSPKFKSSSVPVSAASTETTHPYFMEVLLSASGTHWPRTSILAYLILDLGGLPSKPAITSSNAWYHQRIRGHCCFTRAITTSATDEVWRRFSEYSARSPTKWQLPSA